MNTNDISKQPRPQTETKCLCDWCVRISPMHKRIKDALPEHLKHEFDYLSNRFFNIEMDLDATEAKLNGSWPGWEWIVEERRKHEGRNLTVGVGGPF